jgi:pyridoxine kinase
MEIKTLSDILRACRKIHQRGPKIVLVTSVATDDMPNEQIAMLVSNGLASWMVRTPQLPLMTKVSGAGDATAALFLAKYLEYNNAPKALHYTAAAIYDVFADTFHRGETELQIVRSQESFVEPIYIYELESVDIIH